jgi:hypothetical protein
MLKNFLLQKKSLRRLLKKHQSKKSLRKLLKRQLL